MRILVIGSGGREHALAWKLAQEAEVICAPGNPGIAKIADCFPIPTTDHEALAGFARDREVDLVVIGPEDPLVAGLADRLRAANHSVFGPGADGARLEGSKAFSKALMTKVGVPTAKFQSFTDPASAKAFAATLAMEGRGVVVKASGNALGKGVVVCSEPEEAEEAIDAMLVDRQFGDAGGEIVVEERLVGLEFSLLTLCSGVDTRSLPIAQDYKRALDNDRGPNTGGMGSFSPVPRVSQALVEESETRVVRPILAELNKKGIDFRGVLFSGMLVQEGLPHCLEYNVRFGDPETQSLVLRLGGGFADALKACADGLPLPPVDVKKNAAVTVVVASGGYPGAYERGSPINIGALPSGVEVFHAGTSMEEGILKTAGGRVLAVSAEALTLVQARARAYEGIGAIEFDGMTFRQDVAS